MTEAKPFIHRFDNDGSVLAQTAPHNNTQYHGMGIGRLQPTFLR